MKELKLNPLIELTTSRLLLRALQATDAPALFSLRSNPEVNRYIERTAYTGVEQAEAFIEKTNAGIKNNQWLYWALCKKNHPALIGTCCLWNFTLENTEAEVGYELHPDFQHQGFAHEALQAVLQYSVEKLELKTITAYVHRDNMASKQLLTKSHFYPDMHRKDEQNANHIIYCISR